MPNANNCAPEKIAIIERNGKPGTLSPATNYRTITRGSTASPTSVNRKPIYVASRNGKVLKAVIIVIECASSL